MVAGGQDSRNSEGDGVEYGPNSLMHRNKETYCLRPSKFADILQKPIHLPSLKERRDVCEGASNSYC